jgi:hypothetical protein
MVKNMPDTETLASEVVIAPKMTGPVREMRIDPPHELPRDEVVSQVENRLDYEEDNSAEIESTAELESLPGLPLGDMSEMTPELAEQFQRQARQLAAYLDDRQRDLDHRESELHVQLAQQESAARSARLWFQERNHDLIGRTTALDERDQQLRQREAELQEKSDRTLAAMNSNDSESALAAELKHRSEELAQRENELAVREIELKQRKSVIEQLSKEHARHERDDLDREDALSQREQRLAAAEATLARSRVELDDDRKRFEAESQAARRRFEDERNEFAQKQMRSEQDLRRKQESLVSRSQHLERRGAALDQLRGELLHLERETLERRLVTEELWAQLSATAPPAALTKSLAQLRLKLTEHYRLQAADLARERKDLDELSLRLTQEHDKLASQKREFADWINGQQREIETQAARLEARELQLQAQ